VVARAERRHPESRQQKKARQSKDAGSVRGFGDVFGDEGQRHKGVSTEPVLFYGSYHS